MEYINGVLSHVEEYTTADQIRPGDIIRCVCEQGCIKPAQCPNHCASNPCNPNPQTWEQVLNIRIQPATNSDWFYLELTNNKELGTWGKTLVIRYIHN